MKLKPTYEELERRVQELEKIESELEFSREMLRVYEKASLGYQSLDENGHYIAVNQIWLETLGYTREEVIGKSFADFIHPDWRDHFRENFPGFKSIGEILGAEFEMVKKNGDIIQVSLTGNISRNKNGDFQQTHCIFHDITERKQAETTLRQSEGKYRLLFNMGVDAMFLVDNNNTRILECNKKASRLFGYSSQELLSMKMADLSTTPEETRRRCKQKVSKQERVYQTKDGGLISVEVTSQHFCLANRAVHIANIRDITDKKRAEKALKESEERFKLAMDASREGVYEWDLETRDIYYSPGWKRLLGYEPDELPDDFSVWEKLTRPEDVEKSWQIMQEVVEGQRERFEVEFEMRHKDGHWVHILSRSNLYKDAKGKPVRVVGTHMDITHRKKMETALENERRFLTAVFDNIEEVIVICDENGAIVRFNEAARKLHGLPEQPIKPEQWSEYYNLFRNDGITPLPVQEIPLYRALQGEQVRDTKIVVIPRNSTPHYMICSGQKLTGNTGRIIGAVVAMYDDTRRRMAEMEQKKLQAQLYQAQKMESVGRLAGGVAHDFNNMLGVILGHTELALLQADENHDLYSDLKEIQAAAQRSADITKQLLAFARKQTISPRQLDLNNTVENMLNMLRRLIGEDIDLVWQPAAHVWPVKMDPTQIDQILVNLCVNARDAIDGVGKLTIETQRKSFDEQYCSDHAGFVPGDFVLLTVSDTGSGMDKETLENLFEPFFTTKDVGKGTGMGLATVYGIVKQNNGFINVYSEPGQGSTFRIYLPRLVADEDADKAVFEKKKAAGGSETILLVEDEPSILRMTRMMLERKGYTVFTAATPAEALEKAKNHSGVIDLLMTDVVMPEMNGRDLAGQITALYPDIRLLFMSGYTANVIAHQGILDKGVAFIQKPFSMADMTVKLREVLDKTSGKTQQ
ncbi:MAG: PAS domain S-box protein [Desulfobacteraceae bacterium]